MVWVDMSLRINHHVYYINIIIVSLIPSHWLSEGCFCLMT